MQNVALYRVIHPSHDQDHIKEISMNESYIDVYYKLGLERLKDKNLPLREAVSSDYKILEQFFLNNFIN